ncbi:MAG: tetratricopeptide repeat protein [Planctomycetes bacterium]|nr:tetratricopeptide repeat protein [Planctomycetota bacterium]
MAKNCALLLAVLLCASIGNIKRSAAGEDADFRRANHLYTLHEYQMAVEALNKYLADFPKSERTGEARLLLAESCYQLKDYAKSAAAFDLFLKENPSSPRRAEALQRSVKLCSLTKDYARALENADLFLKENRPKLGQKDAPPALPALFESVLYYAGDSAYALKKYDAARSYWDALNKDFANSKLRADAAEGLGWIAFEKGEFEAAQAQFGLTAAAPNHEKAASSQLMLARCLDELGKSADALAALDKVAALTGGKEQARFVALYKAKFLLRAKRYDQAVPQYKALVKDFAAQPEAASAVAEAAVLLDGDGKNAEALDLAELYLSAFTKGDDRPLMASIKARALVALKRNDEALAAAKTALAEAEALPAGDRRDKIERPAALMFLADLSGADVGKYYQTIVKEHAQSRFAPAAQYQLAYWAGKAGNLDEGLQQVEALLKALPANDKESADLRRKTLFAASDFAFRKADYARAEPLLKEYAALPEVKADAAKMQLGLASLRLAWCRDHANDSGETVRILDGALAAEPKGEVRAEMLYLRGLAQVKAKNPDKGLAAYRLLLKESPESHFADYAAYEAARLAYESGKPEDALPWLDAPLAKDDAKDAPLYLEILMLRAKARYRASKQADALADAEALLKRPDLKDRANAARLLKALSLEALPGKEKESEAAYGEMLATGPAEAAEVQQALFRRAQIRFVSKRFAEARDDYNAFLSKNEVQAENPDTLQAAIRLSVCLKELKDTAGSQAQLDKLAQLKLTGAAAFEVPFQLGNMLYESGKNPEAAAQYKKALDAAQGSKDVPLQALSAAWLNLAWSYERSKDPKQAEAAFAALLKLDPAGPFSAEARYYRGRLLSEAGDAEGALALWKELLEKQSADPLAERALASIADAHAKGGRFPEAVSAYEQYLEKFPNAKGVREAWCGLAECRLQTKKPDAARDAFMKALGEKGLDAELDDVGERVVLGMAELALAKGEAGEGKKLALRVVLDRPDSKWLDAALYLCGRCSEELAEPEKAIGYYRKLLAERPQSPRAETAKERLKALGAPAAKP